jgi:hypothetical protein
MPGQQSVRGRDVFLNVEDVSEVALQIAAKRSTGRNPGATSRAGHAGRAGKEAMTTTPVAFPGLRV